MNVTLSVSGGLIIAIGALGPGIGIGLIGYIIILTILGWLA